jgi:hypothetical protein
MPVFYFRPSRVGGEARKPSRFTLSLLRNNLRKYLRNSPAAKIYIANQASPV